MILGELRDVARGDAVLLDADPIVVLTAKIGRLDAPGAKLEPVMPGLENSTSPNVVPGIALNLLSGSTVTVAN